MTTQDVENMASAFGVGAGELREGLGRHGVTLTEAPTDPATVRGELTVVCDSCSQTFDDPHKFCPECGSRTRAPSADPATDLATRLTSLEKQLSALHTHSGQSSWQWTRLEEAEKWRVWWGIAWRGLVVYAVVWFVLFVIAASTVQ